MLITLFTDASFCPNTRVASYAAWAKVDGITFKYSGIMKGLVPRSDIAELRAVANGIAFVFLRIKPPPGSRIIAQTDCLSAIQSLQKNIA